MNLASVRRVRTLTALLLLLPCLAFASTGGDEYVNGLCLEAGGKRILYGHGDYSESGNADALRAIDLATGKTATLIEQASPSEQPTAEPHVRDCKPLLPAKLSDVGLRAEVRLPKEVPSTFDPKHLPEDEFLFRPMHPFEVVLTAAGQPLYQQTFRACYGSTVAAKFRAYHLPGQRFVAVAIDFPGQCYGGGTYVSTVVAFPKLLKKDVKAAAIDEGAANTLVPVPPPKVPYDRMMNDVGMALYRAGKLKVAADFFGQSFMASQYAKAPYLLPLFNQAATFAKQGNDKEALHALAALFSFKKERERYQAKVLKDPDFKALWNDARLKALLDDPECCLDRDDDRTHDNERTRTVWKYREGESKVVSDEGWRWGRKTRESFEDGSHKQWDHEGRLISEGMNRNGTGWTRYYHPDGTLNFEEHYKDGKKLEPDAGRPIPWAP